MNILPWFGILLWNILKGSGISTLYLKRYEIAGDGVNVRDMILTDTRHCLTFIFVRNPF